MSSFHQSAKANTPDWHITIISLEPQTLAWLQQNVEHYQAKGYVV
jgi:tRNA dimethylallyltransferase